MKILLVLLPVLYVRAGILYPKSSLTRQVTSLDGLWTFTLSKNGSSDGSLTGKEDDHDSHFMPVPSSYNDILTTLDGRDFLGPVTYTRTFTIPKNWIGSGKIWLRFGSVCYSADVYVNGKQAVTHEIGHLPFQAEITSLVVAGDNTITVFVDNSLSSTTIPQGSHTTLPGGRIIQTYTYDFFNYAGIDRSVFIYQTPDTYVDDITITTKIDGTSGVVSYTLRAGGTDNEKVQYKVTILDKDENVAGSSEGVNGNITVTNAVFWWPYLMSNIPGYLYTLRVELLLNSVLVDRYDQTFGIRELKWDSSSFKINEEPLYLRGFGRHEDSDIRGRGLDLPLIIRDYNLIQWVGANCYRTSHYPYAEEIMDMADRLGIMIIDEVPAVNTDHYSDELLENHKRSLTELYRRDKNRPSAVIWSVANEPNTKADASKNYYKQIVAHIKSYDSTRPTTIANYYSFSEDQAGQFLDILSFNRYEGWYIDTGDVDSIVTKIVQQAEGWHKAHNKPVLVTEYGADTLEGLHYLPEYLWSEEYQVDLMSQYFKAFDQLRAEGWFIGELIWNFADFKTASDIRRVGGNKKGIFTRQRQPKAGAHFMRKRYWSLAHRLNNVTVPSDLDTYVIGKPVAYKDEL